MQGRRLVLSTDLEIASKQIKHCDVDPKCLVDVRVARLLSWLWGNFTKGQSKAKFILDEVNKITNVLS